MGISRSLMKKLFLLCALFAAVPAFAQDYYGLQEYGLRKNTTRIEFYGGMTLPKDDWKVHGTELGTTGWTAGIGFTRNIISSFKKLDIEKGYYKV